MSDANDAQNLEKAVAAIQKLVKRNATMIASTRLREDLALDSAQLIELTIIFHSMYGVDIGRKAAESKLVPATIGDLATLLGMP